MLTKKNFALLVPVFAALMGLTASVFAQSARGIYIFGSLGYAEQGVTAGEFTALYAVGPACGPACNGDVIGFSDSSAAYKAGLGYRINENFAVEGSYARIGKMHYHVARGAFQTNTQVEPEAWQLAAVGIIPISKPLEVFAKLGIARVRSKGSIGSTPGPFGPAPVNSPGTLTDDTVPVIGMGLNYEIHRNLFLRGELELYTEYKAVNVPDLRPLFGPLAQKGGTVENSTTVISIGISYRF